MVPLVLPSFDGLENPSISPSEIRSSKVANCLLCKLSGVIVGGLPPPPFLPPPPAPAIFGPNPAL